jgi:Sec-independent protein translocase protein TatA
MERLEIFLFLLGAVSAAVIVLVFLVPILLFGIYRNIRETKSFAEELLREMRMMNYLSGVDETGKNKFSASNRDDTDSKEELERIYRMFLGLTAEEPVSLAEESIEGEKKESEAI